MSPPRGSWIRLALLTGGFLSVVAAAVSCNATIIEPPSEEAVARMRQLMMADGGVAPPTESPDGGTPEEDGGTPEEDGGTPEEDGGSSGEDGGTNSLCDQFTLCETNADCEGNPAGSTCTTCPACGKHCWGGGSGGTTDGGTPRDGGPCTTCICEYGRCYGNADCPSGAQCQGDGSCKADGGATVPTIFKKNCDDWLAAPAQQDCTYKSVAPAGGPLDTRGCGTVKYQVEGHSSTEQCDPFIMTSFSLCLQGCSVQACNTGCRTFADPTQAFNTVESCRAVLDEMGFLYDLTITGNQALSNCGRETHVTLSCSSGGGTDVTYGPCDPNKNCYRVGETSRCSQDGGTVNQVCCPAGGGDPKWQTGTTCTNKPCDELKNSGTCWGGVSPPTTVNCTKPDNTQGQVTCCKADGGAAGRNQWGRWKDSCN